MQVNVVFRRATNLVRCSYMYTHKAVADLRSPVCLQQQASDSFSCLSTNTDGKLVLTSCPGGSSAHTLPCHGRPLQWPWGSATPRGSTPAVCGTHRNDFNDRREQDTRDTLHWYSLIPRSGDPGPGTESTLWDNCPATTYMCVLTFCTHTHKHGWKLNTQPMKQASGTLYA